MLLLVLKHTKQKGKCSGSRGGRGVVAASHFPFWEFSLLLDLLSWRWAALLAFHLPC